MRYGHACIAHMYSFLSPSSFPVYWSHDMFIRDGMDQPICCLDRFLSARINLRIRAGPSSNMFFLSFLLFFLAYLCADLNMKLGLSTLIGVLLERLPAEYWTTDSFSALCSLTEISFKIFENIRWWSILVQFLQDCICFEYLSSVEISCSTQWLWWDFIIRHPGTR